jgi:hypothetical protein
MNSRHTLPYKGKIKKAEAPAMFEHPGARQPKYKFDMQNHNTRPGLIGSILSFFVRKPSNSPSEHTSTESDPFLDRLPDLLQCLDDLDRCIASVKVIESNHNNDDSLLVVWHVLKARMHVRELLTKEVN